MIYSIIPSNVIVNQKENGPYKIVVFKNNTNEDINPNKYPEFNLGYCPHIGFIRNRIIDLIIYDRVLKLNNDDQIVFQDADDELYINNGLNQDSDVIRPKRYTTTGVNLTESKIPFITGYIFKYSYIKKLREKGNLFYNRGVGEDKKLYKLMDHHKFISPDENVVYMYGVSNPISLSGLHKKYIE